MSSGPSGELSTFVGAWSLDAAQTSVEFRTKAMWVLPVKGTATALSGAGTVTDDGGVTGVLVIDATSIATGVAKRDSHLQTGDFFEAAAFPTIEFVATGAKMSGPGTGEVTGQLSVRGQARPITVPVQVEGGADAVIVTAEVDIDRSQWGLTWKKMGAGLHNHVVVRARFIKD